MNRQTFDDVLADLRTLFLRVIAILGIAIGGIGIVPIVLVTLQQGLPVLPFVSFPIAVVVLCSLWLVLASQGRLNTASVGLLLTLSAAVWTPPPALFVIAVVAVLAAAVLGGRVAFVLVNMVVLVRFIAAGVSVAQANPENFVLLGSDVMAPLIVTAIVSITTRYFIFNAARINRESLRGADLLQATAEVAHITSRELMLQPLLEKAIESISQRFGFYHVQVFLLDDTRENAVLVASTGTVGRLLLDRRHKLVVGSRSVIGRVTADGQPVIARDSDPENVRYRNELLPDTRAELALPIRDGDQIIGALDVQSRDESLIDDKTVQALQILANLLATAIRNSRLFEQQTAIAQENEQLYRQTRDNLSEIQRLNRELTGQAWRDFLREGRIIQGVTWDGERMEPTAAWTTLMKQAAHGKMAYQPHASGTRVALPLMLRGASIGVVEIDTSDPLSIEALAGARSILERLTISLENARLYETAQSAIAQETRLNQIAARYQSVNSIDELLNITLQELGTSLGAERSAIRLGQPEGVQNGGSAS
jgi:transcriptional regulator with GAF, ATPase, and Fis domain